MPFARVGAMPPPSRNDEQQPAQQSGRSRTNRQKGITMEDLKKQTALRLAHEQHQGQTLSGSAHSQPAPPTQPVDSRGRPIVTPESLAARSHSASSFGNREPQAPYPPQHYQRLQHNNAVGHHPSYGADISGTTPTYNTGRYYDQGAKHSHRKKGPRPAVSVAVPVASHPSSHGHGLAAVNQPAVIHHQQGATMYHADQRSQQYSRSAAVPTLPDNPNGSASGYDTASSNSGAQTNSSKLPHGLTVHELKEMTKARLQAEAAEKLTTGCPDRPNSATASMTERDSQDSRSNTPANYLQQAATQELLNADNGADSISPTPVDVSGRQPAQVSPPPIIQSYRPATTSFSDSHDQGVVVSNRGRIHSCPDRSWDGRVMGNRNRIDSFPDTNGNRNRLDSFPEMTRNRSRVDSFPDMAGNRNRLDSFPDSNWDNASVTSHNSTVASDYLGSESAYSSGVGGFAQGGDDGPFLPLNRTQSFPVGSGRSAGGSDMPSRETTPTSPQATYYDPSATLAQNRARSLTLSPRPGLSLLHEDRPGFSNEDIGIPSFASSRHARQQLTRTRISPVLHPQGFPADNMGANSMALNGGAYGDNRPRTSSTTSLPPMSHTAEEFAGEFGGSSRRASDSNEEPSSSLAGFYGSANLYGSGGAIGGSSSVFRDGFGGIPAPPGLGPSNDTNFNSGPGMNPLSSNAGSLDSIGSNRARAATWNPGCDVFGSGTGLYECRGDDTLAGDLASILKLSGAEEKTNGGRSGMFQDMSGSFLDSNDFKENDSRSQRF